MPSPWFLITNKNLGKGPILKITPRYGDWRMSVPIEHTLAQEGVWSSILHGQDGSPAGDTAMSGAECPKAVRGAGRPHHCLSFSTRFVL